MIKIEPHEEPECEDEQAEQVIAYPPISRERIKEESQSGENQDDLSLQEQHV